MEKPQSARAAMMVDFEQNRLDARDRQVSISSASRALDEWFKPDEIEDLRDVRRMVQRAAEYAAYYAIQNERELHAGDMAALRAMMESRVAGLNMSPRSILVEPSQAARLEPDRR